MRAGLAGCWLGLAARVRYSNAPFNDAQDLSGVAPDLKKFARISSTSSPARNSMSRRRLLVTSALPYANGSIHLGHLVE